MARSDSFEMLKWARAQSPQCPWNEETSLHAARRGDLMVLQWLRNQDPPCPWNPGVIYKMAEMQSGSYDSESRANETVLLWMQEQPDFCPSWTC